MSELLWDFQKEEAGWEPVSGTAAWRVGLGWVSLPMAITGYINHEIYIRFELPEALTVNRITFRGFTPCGPLTNTARIRFSSGSTLSLIRQRQYSEVPAKQALYAVDYHAFTPISVRFLQLSITPLPVATYPQLNRVQTPGTIARVRVYY